MKLLAQLILYYYQYTCMNILIYNCTKSNKVCYIIVWIFYFINMRILNFKHFMEKYILRNDTMNESDLQRVYIYPIYPRGSKIYSDKGFVNIDNGSMGATRWTCFYVKNNKS